MKNGLILLAAAALSACASPPRAPSEEQLMRADYGPPPTNYQKSVKEYLEHRLKDVDSARFEFFREPGRSWAGTSPPFLYGWAACAYINAKNSYNAYTGTKMYYFYFQGDVVFESAIGDGYQSEQYVSERCARIRGSIN